MRLCRTVFTFCLIALLALLCNQVVLGATNHSSEVSKTNTPSAERRLHILYTTDIFGRYAWPGCNTPRPANHADLSQMVSAVDRISRQIAGEGDGAPVVLHAGSTTRFDAMGSYLFQHGSPKLTAKATALFKTVNFDAVSVGLHDFGSSPKALHRYMQQMQTSGVPLLASNVSCRKKDDFRCRYLRKPYRIFLRNGLRVGVFSVLRQDLSRRIWVQTADSLVVAPPDEAAEKLIKQLRERVDVIIMLAELNTEADSPQPVLDLVERLGSDAPIVVVANQMYSRRRSGFTSQIQRGDGRTVVGTDRFGQHLGHALIRLRKAPTDEGSNKWRAVSVSVKTHEVATYIPDSEAATQVAHLKHALCEHLDKPLGQADFGLATSRNDFISYVQEVMRHKTSAELALINDSAFADTGFPMSGAATVEKVFRAIRTETTVVTIDLTGAALISQLAAHVGGQNGLHVLGLEHRDGKWFVNNRPVITNQRYRVATTAFVAAGGENLISAATKPHLGTQTTLRQMTTEFLAEPKIQETDKYVIASKRDFPDLSDQWLLSTSVDLNTSLGVAALANGAGEQRYNRPLLRRDNVVSTDIALQVYAGASTINQVWELDGQLQYGRIWTRPQGTDTTSSAESNDRLLTSLVYRFERLRNRWGRQLWYIPVPYAEATMQTEITPSATYQDAEGETHTYHFMELSGSVGAGVTFNPLMLAKIGFAVRGELLTPSGADSDLPPQTGLYLGYTLRRMRFWEQTSYPFDIDSRLDYYLTDLAGQRRNDLVWQAGLYVPLTSWLHLNSTYRLHLFDTIDRQASTAHDITVGLNVRLNHRHQFY